jgi:acyl-CoA thioesterase I
MKFILIGVAVLGTFAFIFFKDRSPQQVPITGTNIIAFGDSLVYGYGATKGNDFVTLLSQRIGEPIINAGIPGNTSKDALDRLSKDVLTQDPNIVILVIGGNDFLRRIPKQETLEHIRSIIQQIQATGARVILVGISRLVYNSDYKDIAQELHVYFVPHVMDPILQDKTLMYDAIHPNDGGYKLFTDAVEPYLRQAVEQ